MEHEDLWSEEASIPTVLTVYQYGLEIGLLSADSSSEVASGGVLAGGLAVVRKRTTVSTSGGVRAAGTAAHNDGGLVPVSGGALVGGTAPPARGLNTSGGVRVAGAATTNFVGFITGGVLAGGSSVVQGTFGTGTITDGVLVGGISPAGKVFNEVASGGIEAAGESPNGKAFYWFPTGGVYVGGAQESSYTGDIQATGGVRVAPKSIGVTVANIIPVCIAFAGGAAPNGKLWSYISKPGVRVGGSASLVAYFRPPNIGGGVLVAGNMVSTTKYNSIASGVALVGGKAWEDMDPVVDAVVGGKAIVYITREKSNPAKYKVGQLVYVPCAVLCCYVRQRIVSVVKAEGTYIYDVKLGTFRESALRKIPAQRSCRI